MNSPGVMKQPPQVLVYAPGRDGELSCKVLAGAGHPCVQCASAGELISGLTSHAGALLVAEESLTEPVVRQLMAFIKAQPPWSDLPLLVVAQAESDPARLAALARLGNVSLLTRPMSVDALASTVRSALRARLRQFEVRDLLHLQREQAERKDQFLAMLAHELRNPLAPVRYAAHALQLAPGDPGKVVRIARLLDRQVGHMGSIIDQLLDVTRVSRGLVRLDRRTLDLANLVAESRQAHEPTAQARGIRVTAMTAGPVWVDADETRLRQVVDNLLDNALKFTQAGGEVRIEAAVRQQSALLRISDDGQGIEPYMLPFLFEPFTQADQSLDRPRGGLGLGLALVKGLVELHGGKVAAESAGLGHGTNFTINLPLSESAVQPGGSPGAPAARVGLRRRVLIAEDNVDAAETLRLILETYGYEVFVAHTGPAAVESARQLRPEAILCDIGLPGLNGYEVAKSVRSELPAQRPRLIAITGYGKPEDREAALSAGFDAHFAKPVAPDLLLTQLRELGV